MGTKMRSSKSAVRLRTCSDNAYHVAVRYRRMSVASISLLLSAREACPLQALHVLYAHLALLQAIEDIETLLLEEQVRDDQHRAALLPQFGDKLPEALVGLPIEPLIGFVQ